jgi:hypothetical protein
MDADITEVVSLPGGRYTRIGVTISGRATAGRQVCSNEWASANIIGRSLGRRRVPGAGRRWIG